MADRDASLELSFDLHPLGHRPDLRRFGRRWDTHVVIDGVDHVREEAEVHRVPLFPGEREVVVYFTGAGLQRLGGVLGIKHGRAALKVDARPGQTVRVQFRGGMFWALSGGTLVRL